MKSFSFPVPLMANARSIEKIENAARFLATPTATQARKYLDQPYQLALQIIDQFADGKAKNYEEIAEQTGINENTVRQVIRALEKGGYPLQFAYADLKLKTGRKPVTVQKRKK